MFLVLPKILRSHWFSDNGKSSSGECIDVLEEFSVNNCEHNGKVWSLSIITSTNHYFVLILRYIEECML